MSHDLILYVGEKNVSSWSMRAYLALAHKGLAFEERSISLARDRDRTERRRVSPTGRVPVLHHGNLVIPDSLAILEYLEDAFPPPRHPALWPSDFAVRAHARWLSATMHAHFVELRNGMSFHRCFHPARPPAPPAALADAEELLGLWEETLRGRTDTGPFLFGPFGGADVMFAPAVVRLVAFGVPAETMPLARDYMGAVLDHPPVRRWMDEARRLPPAADD